VNPRTVVIVNSGSPVVMPWRNDVAAVLLSWFGGQEYGDAVADILLGLAEPGGRLPTSWPATLEDVPVIDVTPVDGAVRYTEGIHIGYRAWLKAEREPAYEFGFGLGYTTWDLGAARLSTENVGADGDLTVSVDVTNTGERSGKQVVQVYASRPDSAVDRPVRWLVGFAPVTAEPGATAHVDITVPARAFADWTDEGWHYEPGEFTLHIGTNVGALPLTEKVTVR
jgi:beta-glucosidase